MPEIADFDPEVVGLVLLRRWLRCGTVGGLAGVALAATAYARKRD
jgi:hypothetical protein